MSMVLFMCLLLTLIGALIEIAGYHLHFDDSACPTLLSNFCNFI